MEWETKFRENYEAKVKNPEQIIKKYSEKLKNQTEEEVNLKLQSIISAEALKDTIKFFINGISKKLNLSLSFTKDEYLNLILDSVNQIEDLNQVITDAKQEFNQNSQIPESIKIDYQLVKYEDQYLGFGKNVKSDILAKEISSLFEIALTKVPEDKQEQKELIINIKESLSLFEDFYKPVILNKDKLAQMIDKSIACGMKSHQSTVTNKDYILQQI